MIDNSHSTCIDLAMNCQNKTLLLTGRIKCLKVFDSAHVICMNCGEVL